MNKVKGGAIGGGIAAAVIVGIIIAVLATGSSISPSDKPEITEDVSLEAGRQGDTVSINDSYTINKGDVDFYINDEGKKTYVIKASDSPELGD